MLIKKIIIIIISYYISIFLIIDKNELYHIGASLKDLGKKWFAFSKLNEFLPEILNKLGKS